MTEDMKVAIDEVAAILNLNQETDTKLIKIKSSPCLNIYQKIN